MCNIVQLILLIVIVLMVIVHEHFVLVCPWAIMDWICFAEIWDGRLKHPRFENLT